MGVFNFVKSGVREMMIARPDQFKQLIVYKHPDQNFPAWSQLTIDSDECVVFFKDGRVVGVLPPGRHTMSTDNIPFLNNIINRFTGGEVFISEIFFVKTSPVRSLPFGGPIGDMIDPLTGEQVTPRIFGELSLVVTDPVRFIVGYTGQAAQGNNDEILGWVKGLFMNGVKTTLGELCEVEQKSVLQAISLTTKLAQAFVANAPDLNEVGVRILQMGQFNLNFSDEDRQRLIAANAEIAKANRGVKVAEAAAKAKQYELDQKYAQDARYIQNLAGNYQNYAAGQVMMGAATGMASHGVEGGGIAGAGVQMALGVNMANQMSSAMQSHSAPQPQFTPGGSMVTCAKCNARQPSGKFCAECGTPLAQARKFCSGCGQEMAQSAKFCASCGTPAQAQAPQSPT
ncbi:MAG: SPFH domain-containing protein [Polyangiaceae bacterium]|nr:SPFH domain-containing protein [Polyangiaceae bacterium]